MPKPKSTVPKFGAWHESEDVAYSLAFDKAHIEREYSLHIPEEDENDRIRFKNMLKQREMQTINQRQSNVIPETLKVVFDKAYIEREYSLHVPEEDENDRVRFKNIHKQREMQTINQKQSNVIPETIKDVKQGMKIRDNQDINSDPRSKRAREDNPSYSSAYGSSSSYTQSLSSFGNSEKHGQRNVESDPGHYNVHQNSQQHRERSGVVADKSGKTAVPRFGDWDLQDPASSGEFSIIFKKVREEKSPKPARPPQDSKIYTNTQVSDLLNIHMQNVQCPRSRRLKEAGGAHCVVSDLL